MKKGDDDEVDLNTSTVGDGDDDSSSSDDDDVIDSEVTAGVGGGINITDEYRALILEEEGKVDEIADALLKDTQEINKHFALYDELVCAGFNSPHYQDITPMFVDGTPFLIDGLSLVTCVLHDSNYNRNNGGQLLHFIYLCERIIELICRKGGTCEIIFFKDKADILQDVPELCLLMTVLKIHLSKNTDIAVHEMDTIFSSEFVNYVTELHPSFIVIDFDFAATFVDSLPTPEIVGNVKNLLCYYGLFCLSFGLYCVDISCISFHQSVFYSFVSPLRVKKFNSAMKKDFSLFSAKCRNNITNGITSSLNGEIKKFCKNKVRKYISLQVAELISKDETSFVIENSEIVKIFLLYCSIVECFPLNCRSFNSVNGSVELEVIIKRIIYHLNSCLQSDLINEFDCALIGDVWHGNLFFSILSSLKTPEGGCDIGERLNNLYSELIDEFNEITGNKLAKYPILSNNSKQQLNKIITVQPDTNFTSTSSTEDSSQKYSSEMCENSVSSVSLQDQFNDMILGFCSDIIQGYSVNLPDYFQGKSFEDYGYKEKYHWHCLRSMTDDYDRVRDHQKEFTSLPMKKILKMKAQYARYMTVYGSNIEGKALDSEPIVVCEPQKEIGNKKKQKKQNKVSSSAKKAEIIEKNTIKKKKEVLDAEKQKFDRFLKIYKSNKTEFGDTKLKLVNEVLLQLNSDEYTGKLLYYKMEVLYQFWIDKSKRCSDREKLDLTYLKELFLAIKQLLQSSKKVQSLLTDKQKQKVGKILCNIGFSDLTEKWNLPKDESSLSATAGNGQSYIRFQLTHLGPELDRLVEGQPDDRISGFIPDPWQKKLFDIVDKQQSALIVAPTSSGKTYASYYCMKKVIKESNDGRVIYVAPTKALVNQVAATIYARFKNKNMPQGMSVYGVFTRDYKHYASECQILITVPECLEILLMSPRRYSWLKTLKYVIFDEVHCLGSQTGGVTWERCLMLIQCPFLALSATIQNPREFWNWMQSVETYKKSLDPEIGTQVHLVVHSDRHNDLVKYVYGQDNDLHHIHPYALLTPHLFKVHCGIPGHLSMAPHEALELYDVMIKISPNDEELLELDPDRYFAGSETGYIYRQEVKTYESKLKSIMEKWFTEKRKLCSLVVETLYDPLKNHEDGTKPLTFFQNNIASFVKNLQARNMLPALIFSYDRRYCEIIGEDLAIYFKEKENEYLSLKRPKSNAKVQEYDSDDDGKGQGDEGNEFTKHKSVKQVFRSGGRMERFKRDRGDFFPLGLSKCNIEYSLRGKGVLDTKDLQFIERRLFLEGFKKSSPQVVELQRGVGVHHAGIVKKMRDAVEMLFRTKFLNVVFATGTLALGIHMPCKTVVILGDSPFLNTLEYHQMSGRSGRRGYDKTGDVVFYGIDSDKMRILMTSKLPRISGNFPLTISFVLRLLLLLNDITDKNEKTEKSYKVTLNRTLTVLNQGMLYLTEKNLKDQMTHFVLFSCMLLKKQRLIDASCRPTLMSGFATHLHYHEPGNLAFIYLLRTGVFSELCRSADGTISSDTCEIVVNILCRLFTNMPLKNTLLDKKLLNSVVKLPPLPDNITAAFNNYNDDVKTVYSHYFEGFSKFVTKTVGEDNKLPLSGKIFEGQCDATELLTDGKPTLENTIAGLSKQNVICSAFAGLSGQTDANLYSQDSLISNIRHQVFTDCKIIPLVNVESELNGYAYDFYRHGVLRSIVLDNGLKTGRDYALLYDFMLVLKSIETSLSELGMTDHEIVLESETDEKNLNLCVFNTFTHVRKTYEELFKKAYDLDHV